MALRYVTLVCDAFDASGNPITGGSAAIAPGTILSAPADGQWVPQSPVAVQFSIWQGVTATAKLLATDNADITPSSWTYLISFTGVGGNPPAGTFSLAAGPYPFTATNGSPCVFTPAGGTYPAGNAVQLTGPSLPAGFGTASTYYVVSPSASTFQLASTFGGTAITSSSSGTGSVLTTQVHLSALL